MSEPGVGVAEREVLDRARGHLVAARCGYYRQLEDIAELDRLGVAMQTGDRVIDRLVQDLGLFDPAVAKRMVDEAGDLIPRRSLAGEVLAPRYPCTGAVLEAGRITPEHVVVIRRTMGKLERIPTISPADLADCERILAEAAVGMPPRMLVKVAAKMLADLDPDGAAPREGDDRDDELQMVRRRDGSLAIKGRIRDPLDAEMIVEVFDLLSTPSGTGDDRSRACRQAGALKDLAQDALGAQGLAGDARHEQDTETETETETRPEPEPEPDAEPEPAGGAVPAALVRPQRPARSPGRALITVTIDHRWLCEAVGHGTLDSQVPVDVATVRRWACDAEIVPMVLGSRSEPLDIGRRSRAVPEAISRGLDVRDGGCAFPGCTRRPRRCHAHHVRTWLDHGETRLDNLTLLCRFHHQLVHHGHWTIAMVDGLPWFTPPPWIDPHRQPRPGGRARVPT